VIMTIHLGESWQFGGSGVVRWCAERRPEECVESPVAMPLAYQAYRDPQVFRL
jgi:hypothetical protein